MSSEQIVLVGGSPAETSRSSAVLLELARRLQAAGVASRVYSPREFDLSELAAGKVDAGPIKDFLSAINSARAVVFGTPVYKGVYTGVLKLIVDVIPPDALKTKTGLAIATGKLPAHLETTGAAFAALFKFFAVERVLPFIGLRDEQLRLDDAGVQFEPEAEQLIRGATDGIRRALSG